MIWIQDKPTEPGLYIWKENKDSKPFHILAEVKIKNGRVYINLTLDVDQFEFIPSEEIANRYWMKVH